MTLPGDGLDVTSSGTGEPSEPPRARLAGYRGRPRAM